jgi:hypothetical protein
MQNKANLPDAQMNVSPFITNDYENQPRLRTMKNKPNQSQSNPIQSQYKPNSRNIQIAVNLVKTRNYNNEQRTIIQNKPNQTQFQRQKNAALRSVAQDKCARLADDLFADN